MAKLSIGILGCGRMGRERARCSREWGAQVAAVFDVNDSRSTELADAYGAEKLARMDDLFRRDLDALFICLAPGSRGPAEIGCIESEMPFYVEKPIGLSVVQCKDVLLRLRRKPVMNGVGYMNRYRTSVLMAKEVLQSSPVIGFSAYWVGKRYNVPWWEVEKESGGPHNEQATHLFDLCRFLIGDIQRVYSASQGISRVSTVIECTGSTLGTAFYSCDGAGKDIGIRVFTREGTLVLSGWDFRLTENTIDGRLSLEPDQDIFLLETGSFLRSIESHTSGEIKSDLFDAAKTQAAMDAVRKSDGQHAPVDVNVETFV